MWKKEEAASDKPSPRPEVARAPERPSGARPAGERATIGRSITIRGEVTGDEDLLIQGRVEGSVDLKQHAVTVGSEGKVKASITARVVTIEGSVEGDLTADEQVILRSAARVEGDITAPRVVLEDGARFRGGVDMGDERERGSRMDKGSDSRSQTPAQPERSTASAAASTDESSSKGKNSSEASAGSRK